MNKLQVLLCWLVVCTSFSWQSFDMAFKSDQSGISSKLLDTSSGCWFGTCFIVHNIWEFHHPNWRTHIVQRGRYTTNQILWMNHTQLSATVIFSSPWAAPGLGRRTPLWAPSLVGLWGTRWTHTGRRRCWVMLSADTTDTTEMRYIMV